MVGIERESRLLPTLVFDLSGNPALRGGGGIKAAMVAALPWPLLRQDHNILIRPSALLEEASPKNFVLE